MDEELTTASEIFKRIVNHSGSVVIDCDLCGRTYFSNNESDYDEEGRLEELRELSKKEPEKYIDVVGYTSWGNIDGKQAVIDCICNKLVDYENLIWFNRDIVAEYLVERAKAEHQETGRDLKNAKQAEEAVDKLN